MLSIKINLYKLNGAALTKLKGKKETKECLVIPIEKNGLFVGEKGVYLNLTAFEMKEEQFGQSHLLKMAISKEDYSKMSEEEKNNQPIIGNIKKFEPGRLQPEVNNDWLSDANDDLPF